MSLIRKFLFKNKKHINGLIHVGANVGQEVPMYFEITNSNIFYAYTINGIRLIDNLWNL